MEIHKCERCQRTKETIYMRFDLLEFTICYDCMTTMFSHNHCYLRENKGTICFNTRAVESGIKALPFGSNCGICFRNILKQEMEQGGWKEYGEESTDSRNRLVS